MQKGRTTMTKDVLLKISGLQFTADYDESSEPEPVEIIAPGEYYYKNGKHYIMYDEFMEGFDSVTKNVLKLKEDSLEITKKGSSNVHMVFEKHKKNMTCYTTPFGSLMMGIDAKSISIEESEEQINAKIKYALDVNYEHLADCTISLMVQPKDQPIFSNSLDNL